MPTRAASFSATTCLAGVFLLFASGCGEKKGAGEGCSSNDECASGLVCDKHGNETGKCGTPHGHTHPLEPDAGAADTASPSSDGPRPAETPPTPDTAPSGARDAASTPDRPATTPDTAPPTPDAAPDTASAAAVCETYCTCMETNCRTILGNDFPWNNRGACLTACGQLMESARSCFSRFCTSVPMLNMSEREHTCEHAAGALGTGECP